VAPADAVLEAGSRPRRRAPDKKSWTPKKQRDFLTALAETCNVKLSARLAKVSTSAIYARRERDASFRAGWDRSLAEGYAKLELEMLKRALHGVERVVVTRAGNRETFREYNDRLGLALLRMHRDSVALTSDGIDDNEFEEARERIIERLSRIREREESIETKSRTDALGLIRWAIART
jgi:hypothetical protein